MKKIIFPFLILLLFTISCAQEKKQDLETVTTYYLIRHAEKDKSNPTDKNPNISNIGIQRAENWAKILESIPLDAVYSTKYNRTKQTAKPTALNNSLETKILDLKSFDINDFKIETKGKTVLIVGHSNTTPQFANSFIGVEKYQQINESNFSNLYIITIIGNTVSHKLLQIN